VDRRPALPPRQLRRIVKRAILAGQPVLARSGLSARVWRELERRRAVTTVPEPASGPDGLPVPPPLLRVENVNTPDLDYFFEFGERTARMISAASARHGLPLSDVSRLLDFGCGCGRVLRHWSAYPGLELWGSDLSIAATSWIESNLPFAHARANGLAPPLDYDDETFDLIYAVSVFTHLPEDLGRAWMGELRRILRPGGLLMFTVHGRTYLPHLTRRERAAFERGELVVQFAEAAGANICAVYHPQAYVERLASDFEVLELATPKQHGVGPQDLWIVRRPPVAG